MPEQILSIEEDMNDIFDQIQSREKDEEVPDEKPEKKRDIDGKFVSQDKEDVVTADDSGAVKDDKKQEEIKSDNIVNEPQEQKQTEAPRPPSSWSAAAKVKFSQIDPDVQKEVLKREEDFHKGIEQYKAKAAFGDTLYREIAPYEAMIRSQGSTPEISVRNLLGVAYQLSTGTPQQKQQVISNIANMYGVPMGSAEEQPAVDPTVYALQKEILDLKTKYEQDYNLRQSSTTSSLSNEIETFKSDPSNIFFDNVREDMAALLQTGRANSLKDAYDKACRMNPDVYQTIMAKQSRESEEKRLQEQKKTALEAKRSAPIATRTKGVFAPPTPGNNSIVDTMNSVYDEILSR